MSKRQSKVEKTHTQVFVNMALDMSWRLALVVMVPIVVGYKLDSEFATTPLLTVVGFMLAMGGMAYVMWRTLQVANQMPVPKAKVAKREPRA